MTDQHNQFLKRLHIIGGHKMYATAPLLQEQFDLTEVEAREILAEWIYKNK